MQYSVFIYLKNKSKVSKWSTVQLRTPLLLVVVLVSTKGLAKSIAGWGYGIHPVERTWSVGTVLVKSNP